MVEVIITAPHEELVESTDHNPKHNNPDDDSGIENNDEYNIIPGLKDDRYIYINKTYVYNPETLTPS